MKLRYAALCVAGALTCVPGLSSACGGCFAPPASVSVVTDHRMVLSLSSAETVLWDQIRYAGSPEEFSWILPIRYSAAVRVEVASDAFINLADDLTAPILYSPPCQSPSSFRLDSKSASGVEVRSEGVVGPFAMSIISGSDPAAIRTWLRSNGYAVPDELAPVIERYTELSMDFVALRLRPGEGVDRMTPVRVRMPGYVPSLPLRMIAAGASDRVGLSLVVISANRVEAQNFANAEVDESDLTWDWNAPGNPATDYLRAFDVTNARAGGSAWITESSIPIAAELWADTARVVDPVEEVGHPLEDLAVALAPCTATCFATRLRAVLPRASLDRDLSLYEGSSTLRPREYEYGHVIGDASPTVCGRMAAGLRDGGVAPRDAGVRQPSAPRDAGPLPTPPALAADVTTSQATGGAACAASPARSENSTRLSPVVLATLAAAATWRRLRRRAR